MANEIVIHVRLDKGAAVAEMRALDAEAESSAKKQSSIWNRLAEAHSNAFSNLGKGLGGFTAGAGLLGLASPIAAAGLAMAAFGAVAIPVLSKVSAASNQLQAAQLRYSQATTAAGRTAALNAEKAAIANNNLTASQVKLIGPVNQLQTAFGNLQDKATPAIGALLSLATKLMPAFGTLVVAGGKLTQAIVAPLGALVSSPFFAKFSAQIAQLAAQMGSVLGPVLVQLIKFFMELFTQAGPPGIQLFSVLIPLIIRLATDLVPVIAIVTQLIATILQWLQTTHLLLPVLALVAIEVVALSSPVLAVVAAVAVLIAISVELYKNWHKIWHDIVAAVSDAFNWIKDHWRLLFGILTGPIGIAAIYIFDHFSTIKRYAMDAVNFIIGVWRSIEHGLEEPVIGAYHFILGLVHDIENALGGIASAVNNALGGIPGKVLSFLGFEHGGIIGAAGGGPRSNLTMVGEHGRELVRLPAGSSVMSNPDTEAALAGAGGGGVQTVRVVLDIQGADPEFRTFLKRSIREHGGDPDVIGR